MSRHSRYAEAIWTASRNDESTISFAGANIVAEAVLRLVDAELEEQRHAALAPALTGPQLRVIHEVLSLVTNDPDWADMLGSQRDWQTLERGHSAIRDAWRLACQAHSKAAGEIK